MKKGQGKEKWAIGNGQLAIGNGQLATEKKLCDFFLDSCRDCEKNCNRQWAMGNGQWAMGNGQWAMGNRQWAKKTLRLCVFAVNR